MNVTIIQAHLVWEDKQQNLDAFEEKILNIPETTDLIVLPEMFTTGFSMKPEQFSETNTGTTLTKLKEWAKAKNAAIVSSMIVEEDNTYYNRAYFVFPDGYYQYYNKRHLFRMAQEDRYYAGGQERTIVQYKSWRILLQICYDLRFPIWSRNKGDYDMVIYLANWPASRARAWQTLLKARAIENLSYVVGVNRIGADGNGIEHSGDSAVIDFKGEPITKPKAHATAVETISISKTDLEDFRTKFPAYLDADQFEVKIK